MVWPKKKRKKEREKEKYCLMRAATAGSLISDVCMSLRVQCNVSLLFESLYVTVLN